MSAPVLEVRRLRVRYGEMEAVHGVDLEVRAGEVVGVVGANGAGKTSILRAITGLIRPAGGEIRFLGDSIVGLPPELIARRGLALVPEGRHVFRTLSVQENLILGTTVAPHDAAARIEGVLDRFPILRERRGQRADRLSGGEQQQLAIARALLSRPRLLMLDEPSAGLAPKIIDLVYETLEGLRDAGVTMLLVEQNAARTIDFSDRCVILGTGKLVLSGTRQELQHSGDVLRAYLGGRP